jgi:hypothetical protein
MSTIALERGQESDRRAGIIGTIILHVIMVILFLLFGLSQPDPLPKEDLEIMMADFGTTMTGSGNNETPDPGQKQSSSPAPAKSQPEDIVTDERSTVEIPKPEKPKKPKPEVTPKPTPQPEKPKEPTISPGLQNAMEAWKTKGGGGEGSAKDPGNEGILDGKPEGGGLMQGQGWEIKGSRGAVRGPDLSERPEIQNETWVEVAVKIDRQGEVIGKPWISNAAIQSVDIHNVALRAVKVMRFVSNPTGPPEQVQYVRIKFRP